jgi:PAS domain S-box-containing protein
MENIRYKILLIEDDKLDQRAFERMVRDKSLPYDCVIAASVPDAQSKLVSEKFDVVITDYQLGEGTGFDILDFVKDTPVIFVTGAGNEEIAVKAQRAGAYDYLVKDSERNYLRALPITVENVLKHRKTEEKLRLLSGAVMSTDDSVYIADMGDKITFVNRAFCQTYGYRAEDIIGKDSSTLWVGKQQSEYMKGASRVDGSAWQVGFYHKRKDGSVFPVSLSSSVIQDENGKEIAVVGITRDISDRIHVEEELKKANKELKQRNQLIYGLAVKVSQTLLRLLADGNIHKAEKIVKDFLDISKLDEGKIILEPTEFNFHLIVSEVLQALSPLAAEKNVDLGTFESDSEVIVEADYGRMVQAITNLVYNAIELTPPKGRVGVRIKDIGYQIAVEVQDNGPTIETKEMEKVFELFTLVDKQGCSSEKEFDLGLPLTKKLVEMHGGFIWIESENERGNSFCFTLPKYSVRKDAAFAGVKIGEKLFLRS